MIKIHKASEVKIADIIPRESAEGSRAIEETVATIIDRVKREGDSALVALTEKFDGARLTTLEVAKDEVAEAVKRTDKDFLKTLQIAKDNIEKFHSKQKQSGFSYADGAGSKLGQKVIALDSVGIYVPGGTANYPSTVLMNALPAVIAGVKNIIMVTPPDKNGNISDSILAAAYVAGVKRIFKLGGAQAVAALAYGTESVPAVDKIVGPGNAFVATAKRQVFGTVDIDMIAGPSEILIIADKTCNPVLVASDMLSQAEHDKKAYAVLITDCEGLANSVAQELEIQLATLPRREIAQHSIDTNGRIILVDDLFEAVKISNLIAPEHLEICTDHPFPLFDAVKNAGSVFLGKNTPEALGDYMAGTNHTLPTGGTARFFSPLSVDDFVKKIQYVYYTPKSLERIGARVADFARREGLDAHARSVLRRITNVEIPQ